MIAQSADGVVANATEMAAMGQYDAALSLLNAANGNGSVVPANILRGKIFAQQRKYDEAASCFGEVLKSHPDNQEAHQGLHAIEQLRKSSLRAGLLSGGALPYMALLIVTLCFVGILLYISGRDQGRQNATIQTLQHAYDQQLSATHDLLSALDRSISANDYKTATALENLNRQTEAILASAKADFAVARESSDARLKRLEDATADLHTAVVDSRTYYQQSLAELANANEARKKETVDAISKILSQGQQRDTETADHLAQLVGDEQKHFDVIFGQTLAKFQDLIADDGRRTNAMQQEGSAALGKLSAEIQQRDLKTTQQVAALENASLSLDQQTTSIAADVAKLRQQIALAIPLTQQVERLKDVIQANSRMFFGPDRAHRQEMEQNIARLTQDAAALSDAMRQAHNGGESATSSKP